MKIADFIFKVPFVNFKKRSVKVKIADFREDTPPVPAQCRMREAANRSIASRHLPGGHLLLLRFG